MRSWCRWIDEALAAGPSSLALATVARAQEPAPPPPSPSPSPSPAVDAATPTFSAGVELVTVDVVVTDKKNATLSGIPREEFTILEDGVPQEITSFDNVQVPANASAEPARKPAISDNTTREERTGRSFVIVFDDVHLTLFQAHRAKLAIGQFLKTGVREGDRVTHRGHGRRRLVEHAHGGGARGRRVPAEAPGGPSDTGHLARAHERQRGPAHPHLPRPAGGGARGPPLRLVRIERARPAGPGQRRARRQPVRAGPRGRRLLPGGLAQPHHAAGARPGAPVARRHPRAQVAHPGLAGLHLRPAARRVQGRGADRAPLERRHVLHRHPRPGRHAAT